MYRPAIGSIQTICSVAMAVSMAGPIAIQAEGGDALVSSVNATITTVDGVLLWTDSVFAKALALRAGKNTVVLVSLGALIVSKQMTEGLMAKVDLKRHQLLLSATHTHSGPGAWAEGYVGERFAGPYDENRLAAIVDSTAAAIKRAVSLMEPASVGFASFDATPYVRNRLIRTTTDVDGEFSMMLVRQLDGDQALWGSFAAHATTLGDDNLLVSGDYPGLWEKALEDSAADLAMFAAGGVGSHGPRGDGRGYDRAKSTAEPLADSAIATMSRLSLEDSSAVWSFGLSVDLPPTQWRPEDVFGETGKYRLSPDITGWMLPLSDSYMNAVVIDSTVMISVPVAFSGELWLTLKRYARRDGTRLVATSFGGDYLGYIVPDRYFHLNEYETRTMSWLGPYAGSYFSQLIRGICRRSLSRQIVGRMVCRALGVFDWTFCTDRRTLTVSQSN